MGAGDGGSLRTAAYLATAMGVVHAVLYLLSFWLLRDAPGAKAGDAEIIAYYSGHGRTVLAVGIYLMPFAAIAFIWFTVALRMWIARHERPEHFLFSNLQLVSGIVYSALLLVAAAALSVDAAVLELSGGQINPQSARSFPQFGKMLALILDIRMAGMFALTTASISRTSRLLPMWFAWVSYPVGAVLLFGATFDTRSALLFPAWILLLAAVLIVRVHRAVSAHGEPAASP